MQINVVTGNKGKFLEVQKILAGCGIKAVHVQTDVDEEGDTLEERCLSKARNAFSKIRKPLIVDDTGLFFEVFDNFPGPFPKKVYGELGLEGILTKLKGNKRGAYFKCLICYIDENGYRIFEGVVRGRISETIYEGAPKTLPYDSILVPEGYDKPFCKLTMEEKNSISHRGHALESFADWFSQNNQNIFK